MEVGGRSRRKLPREAAGRGLGERRLLRLRAGVFDYLEGDETVLEDEPLLRLAEDRQIAAFRHEGFWQPMDTYRESQLLNNLWNGGDPPWKVWE